MVLYFSLIMVIERIVVILKFSNNSIVLQMLLFLMIIKLSYYCTLVIWSKLIIFN